MKLKEFSTEIFAGLRNVNVSFDDGINILLGPNEAGKSTIINAIFVSLFIEPKLRYNYNGLKGKGFRDRFFPYPEGNYAEANLKLEINRKNYNIYKRWSNNNPDGYLELPDGSRISYDQMKERRQELIPYGKSTFNNIVFTKQEEVRTFLRKITNEDKFNDLKGTVSNFLRKAVMQLGDISVEELRNKLDEKYTNLTSKWDLDNNRPSNPERGVDDPLTRGTGKIYDVFIEKEKLIRDIRSAKDKENEYQDILSGLEELKSQREELKEKREKLSDLEEDIIKRQELEGKIKKIEEKLEKMEEVNDKWPDTEDDLNKKEKELKELNNKSKELEEEKERAEKLKEKSKVQDKIDKIDKLKEKRNDLAKAKDKLGDINKEKVDKLEECKKSLDNIEASLKAGRLTAKINRSVSDDITAQPGVEEERKVNIGEEIEADGYIHINSKYIDLEVESAEIDFDQFKKDYKEAKKEYKRLLGELEVEDVGSARKKLDELKDLNKDIETKQNRIEEILGDKEYQALKEKLKEYDDLKEARDMEEIDEEIDTKKDEKRDLKTKIELIENKIEEWIEEYDNQDELEKKIKEGKVNKKEYKKELESLAKLPDEYDSPEEFRSDLKEVREKCEKLGDIIRVKQGEMYDAKSSLPDVSTEEMKENLKEKEDEFERLVEKAEKYAKIKEVFEAKLEELDEKSFIPLTNSFNNYITCITNGKYEVDLIDDEFKIRLKNNRGKKLPADRKLLSYGTYDGTALALRFALFENIFKDIGGFIVLDDCLVNLDPKRKEETVGLIKSFGKKYQILYSTCSPDIAKELGGNMINI